MHVNIPVTETPASLQIRNMRIIGAVPVAEMIVTTVCPSHFIHILLPVIMSPVTISTCVRTYTAGPRGVQMGRLCAEPWLQEKLRSWAESILRK